MDKKAFGKLLAVLRDEVHWTQADLAEMVEVETGVISNLERGTKKNLEPELLFRLANALGLTTLERREFFLAASGFCKYRFSWLYGVVFLRFGLVCDKVLFVMMERMESVF